MVELILVRSSHDKFWRRGIPDGRVLAGLAEPRRILLPHVPARLVLIPVVRAREHRAPFVPDDLLWVEEADPKEPVQHLAGKDGCVPYVRNLQTRHQFEGLGPIGARVSGDGRFRVALGAVLHIAGFGWP